MNPSAAVVTAELTKIRTLWSTFWTLLLAFVLSVGLSVLLGLNVRSSFATASPEMRESYDPLFITFYSLTLGQLPLVVLGVLVVSGEYGSGTIRAALLAVPRRGLFYRCKVLAASLLIIVFSVITVLSTFFAAQEALGPYRTSMDTPGVPQAIIGACLYLPLIFLFALGVATILRSSVGSLAILLPVLFLGSQGIGNAPGIRAVLQYLPDQAGGVIMHIYGIGDEPNFARDYGPWTGVGILTLWTAVALLGGLLVLRRRDA